MNKTLLLIGITGIINSFFAQTPTILGTYLPVVNTEIKQVWIYPSIPGFATSSVPLPSYGANQIWDYSMLPMSIETGVNKNTHTLRTIPTNTSPGNTYVANYLEATHVSHWTSPIAGFDTVWTYSKVDTSGMSTVGLVNLSSGFPINIDYQNLDYTTGEEIMIPGIVDVNTVLQDSILRETVLPFTPSGFPNVPASSSPLTIHQYSFIKLEIKGWGSLKTPIDSLGDVLLGRVRDHEVTYYINNTSDTVLAATNDREYFKHFFLRNNTFATSLLMQLNTDTALTNVEYAWYTLPSKVGTINGIVYDSVNSGTINSGTVLLYREHGNFTKDDVLDSAIIGNGGTYSFSQIPLGQYRLLVKPDPLQYPNSYSTYYEETPNMSDPMQGTSWNHCDLLVTTADTTGVDIVVRRNDFVPATIPNQLNGTLSGFSVTKIGGDDPIGGIDIIVKKDPSSRPVISTETNEFGEFSIDNIPDGKYKIWVDMSGLNLDSAHTYHFEVINGQYNRCEFDFKANLDSLERTGQDVACAWSIVLEQNKKENNLLIVSPNPFENTTLISLNLKEFKDVTIEVYDVAGKLIQTIASNQNLNGSQKFEINKIQNSGVYFVKATIGQEIITKRLIKL